MPSYLSWHVQALRVCGLLPRQVDAHPANAHPPKVVQHLHALAFIGPTCVHLLLTLVFITLFANSSEVLTIDIACSLGANIVKYFVYLRHGAELVRLVAEINELAALGDARMAATHARVEKTGRVLLAGFYCTVFSSGISYTMNSVLSVMSSKPHLPFKTWYPFDVEKHFKVALAMQMHMALACNTCLPVMDTILPALLLHSGCQLDELARALRSIGRMGRTERVRSEPSDDECESSTELEDCDRLTTTTLGGGVRPERRPRVRFVSVQRESIAGLGDAVDEEEAYRRLMECVRWHQRLLSLVHDVGALFSPIIFVQLLSNSVVICLVTFQIVQHGKMDSMLLAEVLYLGVALMQIGFFCFFGSELQAKGAAVATASYHTRWQERSVRFGKTLRMLILRAQHPLVIVGGKFYAMTLHTFVAICRASVSYFSVLRQVSTDY